MCFSHMVFFLFAIGTKRKRRSITAHSIDDKIETLRQDMNTSLNGVKLNLYGVAKPLITMLVTSLTELSDEPYFKKSISFFVVSFFIKTFINLL